MATSSPRKTSARGTLRSTVSAQESALPKFLIRRGQTYYFKRKVPAELRPYFENKQQIWKSLGTTNLHMARQLLAKEAASFDLIIANIRLQQVDFTADLALGTDSRVRPPRMTLTANLIPDLISRYKSLMLLADDEERAALRTAATDNAAVRAAKATDFAHRENILNEYLAFYQNAQAFDDCSVVNETVQQLVIGEGLRAPGAQVHNELCSRLLSADIEILQIQLERMKGKKTTTPDVTALQLQPTLADYLREWAEAKPRSQKTYDTIERMVRLWNERMGIRPAAGISDIDVRVFRDSLAADGLSAATIKNRLVLMCSIVNAYHKEKSIKNRDNPFFLVPVKDQGQRQRQRKNRRAFESSELNQIVQSSLYTKHELPTGSVGEAAYWAPLMGPFVGARIEEIAQLRLDDIEIINGTWAIRICDLDLETQKLKTMNSFRRIPVHQELIKLGFLKYVCDMKRNGEERLFSTLSNENKYKKWSNALGKWFARFLSKIGVTSVNVDYHSYRYLFKQRLSQCGVNPEVRDALAGHWSAKDGGGQVYNSQANGQYDFTLLCMAMEKLRYDELELSHLYVNNPYEGVDKSLFLGLRSN